MNEIVSMTGHPEGQVGRLDLSPFISERTGYHNGIIEYVREITEQKSAGNALMDTEL